MYAKNSKLYKSVSIADVSFAPAQLRNIVSMIDVWSSGRARLGDLGEIRGLSKWLPSRCYPIYSVTTSTNQLLPSGYDCYIAMERSTHF